jgi:hypothetical protein
MSTKKDRAAGHKTRARSAHEPPAIDFKVILMIMTVIGCCVFLWDYLQHTARSSSAKERQVITRPTEEARP